MAKTKNKRSAKQFLIIAVLLLILGGALLLNESKNNTMISEIIEESGPVTNVELVGDGEDMAEIMIEEEEVKMEIVNEEVMVTEDAGIMDYTPEVNPAEITSVVRNYFNAYNSGDFTEACRLITGDKCNERNPGDVSRFSQEFNKMNEGYKNLNFWFANTEEFHSDVVCVEYDYTYKSSPSVILHEVMSFYVVDGEITSRVCEKKTADGSEISCPIQSKRDFCL